MDRQTDGRTDRFAISISRVSMLTHDKNWPSQELQSSYQLLFVKDRILGQKLSERYVFCYHVMLQVDK